MGLYDELYSFLSQLNLYRGKGLTLSHELALFLQLYNGHEQQVCTLMLLFFFETIIHFIVLAGTCYYLKLFSLKLQLKV